MPSNGEEGKDVPIFNTLINTLKKRTNIYPTTPKGVSCKLPKVFSKVTFCKQSLIKKCQLLAKSHEQFYKRFY